MIIPDPDRPGWYIGIMSPRQFEDLQMEGSMKEFIGKGTITLEGVVFGVRAENLEEAHKLLLRGEWDWYETDMAEVVNYGIAHHSIVEDL